MLLAEQHFIKKEHKYYKEIDNLAFPKHGDETIPAFSGKRVKRGMYKSKDCKKVNADVNGSFNIIRKVFREF